MEALSGFLECVECGCVSGELGRGWAAFIVGDPDELDSPAIAVYCPPCANAEFGHRPEVADVYT